MKSLTEMDLEDWELLSDDGYLEINEDGGKKIYSREYPKSSLSPSSPTVFQMNYFICPPKPIENTNTTTNNNNNNQLLPVPVDLLPHDQAPIQITSFGAAVDPDPVSQVFFMKMKEPEFVDMKLDSPKSPRSCQGIMPQLDFQLGENREEEEEEKGNNNNHSYININEGGDEGEGGLNIWKWSLTGIGAICSFGVAAATVVCIISFSSRKHPHPHHNHKLQFQIYTNDKRMKQVVDHASKLNEAHITFGGYYDASL